MEQFGKFNKDNNKVASTKIKIKAEIGFVGLFKAGIEWIKRVTNPQTIIDETNGIGSSGDGAQIGSSGDGAQIGSSGDGAVICCAGHGGRVKAKKGSWITLSEWESQGGKFVPKCVKTVFVDGKTIKADTWYELVNGKFKKVTNEAD